MKNELSANEKRIIEEIDLKQDLAEADLETLIFEYEIKRDVGDCEGTRRSVSSLVKIGGRTFTINWLQELSDDWPNTYDCQPEEVFGPRVSTDTITQQTYVWADAEGKPSFSYTETVE